MEVLYVHTEMVHNFNAANEVLPFVISTFKPDSMLDVGCGIGTWLKVAKELGVNKVIGVDGGYVNRDLLKINENEFICKDLRNSFSLNYKFDIALCLEVAEHLPEEAAVNLINTLCNHTDTVIFSAAIPNQGGQNHINEQWPEYWIKLFAENGFSVYDLLRARFWNNEKVEFWYRQNMLIFSKNNLTNFMKCPETGRYAFIHPELFISKINEINRLENMLKNASENPGVKSSFKLLVKSLKRKLKV